MQNLEYVKHFNKLMDLLDNLPNSLSYSETMKIQQIMKDCFNDGESKTSAEWHKYLKWKSLNEEYSKNNPVKHDKLLTSESVIGIKNAKLFH